MRALVTGGAGFIGSHLCDRLTGQGAEVWCIDNLHFGRRRNVEHLKTSTGFHFVELDVLDAKKLDALFTEAKFDSVFHLAANSDIAAGAVDPKLDLRLNQLTTLNVLEAMRKHSVERLFFASSSAVFGESSAVLHEDFGPLQPISFYGASKLAAEAYVSTYAHLFGLCAVVLRFPNVVGERATHGVIYDFLRKLENNSVVLNVLGDGNQTKPYLYVADLIDAILLVWEQTSGALSVYHAAGIGETSVREIAEIVLAATGHSDAKIRYTGGDRGWPGDVPRFRYDISRLLALGWSPQRRSTDAVRHAVERIKANGF
jgi:UDP-glucose 4-epimerase